MYVIMENVCVFQDDEDSISELMVDRDKKPRFKLEKVGQVMIWLLTHVNLKLQ